jgi:hypothetical protein
MRMAPSANMERRRFVLIGAKDNKKVWARASYIDVHEKLTIRE